MRFPKIKTKKIKDLLKKLPRTLAEKILLTIFILLIFALITGCLIFYQYSFLAEKREPEVLKTTLKFQEKTYENVLKIWQEKEKRFQETDLKEYPDLFR